MRFALALCLALNLAGCTVVGAGIGKSRPKQPRHDGGSPETYVVEGAAAGAVVDVLVIGLSTWWLSKRLDDGFGQLAVDPSHP